MVKLTDKLLGAYSSFKGSPAHKGKLQFDLWEDEAISENLERKDMLTCGYNWEELKTDIKLGGCVILYC